MSKSVFGYFKINKKFRRPLSSRGVGGIRIFFWRFPYFLHCSSLVVVLWVVMVELTAHKAVNHQANPAILVVKTCVHKRKELGYTGLLDIVLKGSTCFKHLK